MHNTGKILSIFAAKGATGTGLAHLMLDYEKIILQLGTASSANFTIKFQGSYSDTPPTFSAAQSATNHWDYLDVIDLEDGASIDGDTGVSCTGTDDFRNFEVNAGGVKWICATITAWSAGTVTLGTFGVTH